eukprot:828296-Pleurochrysis_carterae.AAC.2
MDDTMETLEAKLAGQTRTSNLHYWHALARLPHSCASPSSFSVGLVCVVLPVEHIFLSSHMTPTLCAHVCAHCSALEFPLLAAPSRTTVRTAARFAHVLIADALSDTVTQFVHKLVCPRVIYLGVPYAHDLESRHCVC